MRGHLKGKKYSIKDLCITWVREKKIINNSAKTTKKPNYKTCAKNSNNGKICDAMHTYGANSA